VLLGTTRLSGTVANQHLWRCADWATVATSSPLLTRSRKTSRSRATGLIGVFSTSLRLFALICAVFLISIIVSSIPAWSHSGASIIYGRVWSQSTNSFGALAIITGTLATTAIALFFAIPIGVGSAIAIVHLLPGRLKILLSSLVELLAAVPSVVYGCGPARARPWFEKTVEPGLQASLVADFPFKPAGGRFVALAGGVLFVMILPMIVALSRMPSRSCPTSSSKGHSAWVRRSGSDPKVVLPGARTGIVGAVTLATARLWARRWLSPWS